MSGTNHLASTPPCGPFLLTKGLILDGAGAEGFTGDVLIEDGQIREVSTTPLEAECPALDCSGKVIAPGFIDAHSHMDWVMAAPDFEKHLTPFLAQGCTTFVAGNCGFGLGGFRKKTPFRAGLTSDLAPGLDLAWDTMGGYFNHLRSRGMTHNLAAMVGHGTTRASIHGHAAGPLTAGEQAELLELLGTAMDEGAAGVSLGLQYAPGLFAPMAELESVARLVKAKDKILTVHGRAYSCLSAEYPPNPLGGPHHVRALNEMLDLARKTGVRLQYSHLIFAGTRTHRTYGQCTEAIDKALAKGVDVATDTYPYHCGNSVLTVVLPRWFRENLPANYDNPLALARLKAEVTILTRWVGIGYGDIELADAAHPDFRSLEGMSMAEIAREWGVSPFRAFVRMAKACHGRQTLILLRQYSNMEIIDALMRHPACLFMTDAVPGEKTRNPAAYGTFPRFLQYARERKQISLPEAVRKMTGLAADRFRLEGRGYIKPGMAADITVFDPAHVADNTTQGNPEAAPTGIEAVFVNGRQAVAGERVEPGILAGEVVALA